MGGINLNESGLDFVRQVFVTFGGNTTVLTLFLLSVLYLALKGKKEERYVFVTTAVFLAFTVYNPFAVKYILGKLGMVNVYYRFFWILPMVLTIGYACTKVVGGQKKGWRRYLTAAALAAVICFGGNSVLAGGLPKLPDNQYKMPDDLLAVCTVLHEEAGEGTVRVVFEPDFNLIVRQYDASFELVLDRDMVLTYQGSNTVSTDALTEQEIEDETKILQIITQMDLSLDQKEFYRSLREMNAEYIVLSSSSAAVSYVETAGCIPVREVEGHIISAWKKSKKEDLFLNKAKDYIQLHLNILLFSLTSVFSKAASVQLNRGGIKNPLLYVFLFLMVANCGIYAIAWQKVIKKFSLSTAYANRSVYLIWSQIWAVLIFHENLTVKKYHRPSDCAGGSYGGAAI